jgi:hypothetical protein
LRDKLRDNKLDAINATGNVQGTRGSGQEIYG